MRGAGIWRRDQDEFVAHEGLDVNSALAGRAFDESDGDFAVEQKFDDFFGVAAVQRELYAGMLVEKGTDQARKNVLGDRGGDAESEVARELPVVGTQLLFGFGGQGRNLFGVTEESRSLRGERERSAERSKRRAPRSFSRALIWSVIAGCVRNRCSAALRK